MKKLYWSSKVKRKNTTPSIAMANKFFPTKSQARGSKVCLVPVDINSSARKQARLPSSVAVCGKLITASLPTSSTSRACGMCRRARASRAATSGAEVGEDGGQIVPCAQTGLQEQRRATAAQLALGDDGDPVTKEICLVHIMGGQDDGAI
ncbi:hypothetical protein JZ751_024639 [Albula glossodonta]|uniref:Uncharacterized protein n=1 Tax=Albula glossodonta TaxID=121402 RepID=A0A8T2PF62_9TELE|nr:hypothetical protein JZ751_024639 [Albula glossodonta]